MSKLLAFGYRNTQLTDLNMCRLFCHASQISDITTGDGLRIQPESSNRQRTDSSGTKYNWPEHGRLKKAAWELWRLAVRQCYLKLQPTQQQLRQALGLWITTTPKAQKWFYSPSQDRVY